MKKHFSILGLCLLIGGIAVIAILRITLSIHQSVVTRANTSAPVWHPTSDLIAEGKISNKTPIASITLHYDKNTTPPFHIKTIQKLQGYPERSLQATPSMYTIELLNSNDTILSSLAFDISASTATMNAVVDGNATSKDQVLTLAWNDTAANLKIIDSSGNTVFTQSLVNNPLTHILPALSTEHPSTQSIQGDELLSPSPSPKQYLLPNFFNVFKPFASIEHSYALSPNSHLNIVFVSSQYAATDMAHFHTDVNNITQGILRFEPFHYRASQIMFHTLENTQNFNCSLTGGADSASAACDIALIQQTVINAGLPFDSIVIVQNAPTAGGFASPNDKIAVVYNQTSIANSTFASDVTPHELGHTLTKFIDAYKRQGIGTLDNTTHGVNTISPGNCYAGTPPTAEWAGMVGFKDYELGCYFNNWYYAGTGTMENAGIPHYNAPEQKLMNKVIDTAAGVYNAPIAAPQIEILSHMDNDTISKRGGANASFIDFVDVHVTGNDIAYVQYFYDGQLMHSEYTPPLTTDLFGPSIHNFPIPPTGVLYEYPWLIVPSDYGPHTLQVKAVNANGQITAAPLIHITVSSTIPSPSPTPTDAVLVITSPPTPTPTLAAGGGGGTILQLLLCPHGLGACGDNANPTGQGNQNPLHKTRDVTVSLTDISNNPVFNHLASVSYDTASGTFKGPVDLGNLPTGNYIGRASMPGYLTGRIGGSVVIQVTQGQQVQPPTTKLVTGDITGDNRLDILDYNQIVNCFGTKANTSACVDKVKPDLDDNGPINGIDYNLILREFSVQSGG